MYTAVTQVSMYTASSLYPHPTQSGVSNIQPPTVATHLQNLPPPLTFSNTLLRMSWQNYVDEQLVATKVSK